MRQGRNDGHVFRHCRLSLGLGAGEFPERRWWLRDREDVICRRAVGGRGFARLAVDGRTEIGRYREMRRIESEVSVKSGRVEGDRSECIVLCQRVLNKRFSLFDHLRHTLFTRPEGCSSRRKGTCTAPSRAVALKERLDRFDRHRPYCHPIPSRRRGLLTVDQLRDPLWWRVQRPNAEVLSR